jgi:hypothetical protein
VGEVPELRGATIRIDCSAFVQHARLTRRGSGRARTIALVVAALGLVAAVAAFYTEVLALTFVGVPAFIFGLATFGALSQRVRA